MPLQTIKPSIKNFIEKSINETEQTVFDKAEKISETNPQESIIELGKYYKNTIEQIEKVKEKLAPFETQLRSLKALQENSKKVAHHILVGNQLTQVIDAQATVTLQKCPVSCNIVNEDAIPEEFYKIVKKFSKSGLNTAHKNGQIIAGAEFIDDKTTVKII